MADSALQIGNDVAKTMANLSKALDASVKAALKDAGKTAKDELEAQGRRRTGDLRFSNMRGAKIGVRTRVSSDEVTVSPSGPWGILEPGAKGHQIGTKGRPLKINGKVVRGPVKHPGTRDTRAWSIGQDETFRVVGEQFPKQVGDDVEEAFGG